MATKIYNVDLSQRITPKLVRDAIIECFADAHCEVIKRMKQKESFKTDKEFDKIKKLNVRVLIKSIFLKIGANFENPTKENLIKVIDELSKQAAQFRSPEIIKKHYEEIMQLIKRLE